MSWFHSSLTPGLPKPWQVDGMTNGKKKSQQSQSFLAYQTDTSNWTSFRSSATPCNRFTSAGGQHQRTHHVPDSPTFCYPCLCVVHSGWGQQDLMICFYQKTYGRKR